jgi:Zn-dependent metalloprotease
VNVLGRFTRLAVIIVAVGLVTGVASAAQNSSARSSAAGPSPEQLNQLKGQARGAVTISAESATNYASFVRVEQGGDLLPGSTATSPEAKAFDFVSRYAAVLGLGDGSALVKAATSIDQYGATHVTYRQVHKGVAVFGGTLKAHVDADGSLTSVNGTLVPDIQVNTTPRLSEAQAAARAIEQVVADPPRDAVTGGARFLTAGELRATASLYVYRLGLVKGVPGASQLVYEVAVTNGNDVREVVFVNAHVGKIVNRYSAIGNALFRRVFEGRPPVQVWMEGDPFPGTLNADQQNLVNFSGHTYWLFWNAFARDSWDGAGAEMQTINNDPAINCPNANWNGATTNYCTGVTGDDTVAHEWAHAYTERTHNLIYQWQPGALNEAYSDIWGEVVDLINNAGTDTPDTVRTVGACSTHSPAIPIVVINSPASIARICPAGSAAFGPPVTATNTVTGNVVIGVDEANAAGPSTTDGCTAFTNAAAVAGKVAMVDRGTCGFVVKAKNANNAGAIALIVANNTGTGINNMAGVDPTITIPTLMISLPNGNAIKGALTAGETVNVTFRVRGGGSAPEDSYRWLSGEDDPAFGGAIRDMWNPQCYGDPGKVSDAEYHCDTSDNGGVHTNSGVVNHLFALLVDGGTYNGQTVGAIGLTKASHLYWRAQSEYQTRTTDFNDHADALLASCTDLIGQPLTGLSTTSTPAPAFPGTFTAADCASVTAVIAAVELRRDPTAQCNFQPILAKNTPDLCPTGQKPDEIWDEDFRRGLRGWTLSNQGVFSGWPNLNWKRSTTLPGGRSGSAAFAEDPDLGNCDGGAGDISGAMFMESPSIRIRPPRRTQSLKLSFEHYVATETGWDGGNISISINGGPYTIVPASAFLFNAYNMTLQTVAAGNTNPLAGQPGFSGTDGGQPTGSWGESQIDLTALGVKSGDRIRLRFNFGMDGCTGIDGWYVDNIEITACKLKGRGDDDDDDDDDDD